MLLIIKPGDKIFLDNLFI